MSGTKDNEHQWILEFPLPDGSPCHLSPDQALFLIGELTKAEERGDDITLEFDTADGAHRLPVAAEVVSEMLTRLCQLVGHELSSN